MEAEAQPPLPAPPSAVGPDGRYILIRKIGSGSFGQIYEGIAADTQLKVAIKLELATSKHPQLVYEARVLRVLHSNQFPPAVGFPHVNWAGNAGPDYLAMVMSYLGPSLEDLFNFCDRRFSLKTVLQLADQMVARLQSLHQRHFIHRDIKPDNFLVGVGDREAQNTIHAIDFGLSKRYRDPQSMEHIPYREGKQLTGTARYVSLSTHMGREQARRDDLESLGYVLMYFLRGALPWQGLRAKDKKQKYQKIMESKMRTSTDALCKGYPVEMKTYLDYCKSLGFEEEPDYGYCRRLFRDAAAAAGITFDGVYDWHLRGAPPSPRWPAPVPQSLMHMVQLPRASPEPGAAAAAAAAAYGFAGSAAAAAVMLQGPKDGAVTPGMDSTMWHDPTAVYAHGGPGADHSGVGAMSHVTMAGSPVPPGPGHGGATPGLSYSYYGASPHPQPPTPDQMGSGQQQAHAQAQAQALAARMASARRDGSPATAMTLDAFPFPTTRLTPALVSPGPSPAAEQMGAATAQSGPGAGFPHIAQPGSGAGSMNGPRGAAYANTGYTQQQSQQQQYAQAAQQQQYGQQRKESYQQAGGCAMLADSPSPAPMFRGAPAPPHFAFPGPAATAAAALAAVTGLDGDGDGDMDGMAPPHQPQRAVAAVEAYSGFPPVHTAMPAWPLEPAPYGRGSGSGQHLSTSSLPPCSPTAALAMPPHMRGLTASGSGSGGTMVMAAAASSSILRSSPLATKELLLASMTGAGVAADTEEVDADMQVHTGAQALSPLTGRTRSGGGDPSAPDPGPMLPGPAPAADRLPPVHGASSSRGPPLVNVEMLHGQRWDSSVPDKALTPTAAVARAGAVPAHLQVAVGDVSSWNPPSASSATSPQSVPQPLTGSTTRSGTRSGGGATKGLQAVLRSYTTRSSIHGGAGAGGTGTGAGGAGPSYSS